MNLIKPKKLKKGDTIGILALSGAVEDKVATLRAVEYFENKGFKVVLSDKVFAKHFYLAATDEERLAELHNFFASPQIDAILCLRGGYGALRLVDKIDYELVSKNPKIFAGYSDTSILNAMFLKKAELQTFYAPMALGDFGVEKVSEFTAKNFFEALAQDDFEFTGTKVYYAGKAEGITFGGNLATLASLAGVDFVPDEKFIFFAEDLNEPTYKIDRYFTQLLRVENFRKNLVGIALGDFMFVDDAVALEEFFKELAQTLKVPFVGGFKITHATEKVTVPYGGQSILENEVLKNV